MENKPKISVLMSIYNTDFSLVKRAVDSVLSQDFQDFEIIMIDDGSHNDPQNLLLNYAKKYSNKISYLRHNNCGQSISINKGVLISKGDFVAILDADDEYKPNHLHACLQEMKHADLIASTTKTIVDKLEDYYVPDKQDQSQVIHVDDCVLFATLFGKRQVFVNILFEDIYAADAKFYEIAAKFYRVKKVNLRTYIYYRNTTNSICAKIKRKNIPLSI